MSNNVKIYLVCLALLPIAYSCNQAAQKKSSVDTANSASADSGTRDSVLNNTQKNYGNAAISEPCEKCLIGIIKTSDSFKTTTNGLAGSGLVFTINWVKGSAPYEVGNGRKITNGLEVDINQKTGGAVKNLASYVYDNEKEKLYLRNSKQKYEEDLLKIDSASLKRVRNSCYWGVASH